MREAFSPWPLGHRLLAKLALPPALAQGLIILPLSIPTIQGKLSWLLYKHVARAPACVMKRRAAPQERLHDQLSASRKRSWMPCLKASSYSALKSQIAASAGS